MTALAMTPSLRGLGPPGAAVLVLTVATATATAGAAILAEIIGRVCDDPRWSWAAAAFALYGVVVLPVSALAASGDTPRLLLIRVVAYVVALPLLVASLRPPQRLSPAVPWMLTVVGALLATAGLGGARDRGPEQGRDGRARRGGAAGVDGGRGRLRRRRATAAAAGRGCGSGSVSRWSRSPSSTGWRRVRRSGDPVFTALRLVGAVVVLVALARLVARSIAAVRSQQFAQQEELSVAAVHLGRAQDLAAERDHELRNGLAGLAGITHLLSSGTDDEEQQRLRQAVLSELTRLHKILDGGGLVFEAPDGPTARRVRRRAGAGRVGHAAYVRGSAGDGRRRSGAARVRRRRGARPGDHQPAGQLRPARARARRSPSAGTARATGS